MRRLNEVFWEATGFLAVGLILYFIGRLFWQFIKIII